MVEESEEIEGGDILIFSTSQPRAHNFGIVKKIAKKFEQTRKYNKEDALPITKNALLQKQLDTARTTHTSANLTTNDKMTWPPASRVPILQTRTKTVGRKKGYVSLLFIYIYIFNFF